VADVLGRTPIHAAAFGNTDDTLRVIPLLIQCGADINSLDGKGDSPITLAVKWGRLPATVDLLRSHGADIAQCDPYGGANTLVLAARHLKYDVAESLLTSVECQPEYLATTTKDGKGVLHHLALTDARMVRLFADIAQKRLLMTGLAVAAKDGLGKTPLQLLNETSPDMEMRQEFGRLLDAVETAAGYAAPTKCAIVREEGEEVEYGEDVSEDEEFFDVPVKSMGSGVAVSS